MSVQVRGYGLGLLEAAGGFVAEGRPNSSRVSTSILDSSSQRAGAAQSPTCLNHVCRLRYEVCTGIPLYVCGITIRDSPTKQG